MQSDISFTSSFGGGCPEYSHLREAFHFLQDAYNKEIGSDYKPLYSPWACCKYTLYTSYSAVGLSNYVLRAVQNIGTSISAAQESFGKVGSAIEVASQLVTSLETLGAGSDDNSPYSWFMSEFLNHINSFDLKRVWNGVRHIWSNFVINVTRLTSCMKSPIADGLSSGWAINIRL